LLCASDAREEPCVSMMSQAFRTLVGDVPPAGIALSAIGALQANVFGPTTPINSGGGILGGQSRETPSRFTYRPVVVTAEPPSSARRAVVYSRRRVSSAYLAHHS
jgi:hypothetical protein